MLLEAMCGPFTRKENFQRIAKYLGLKVLQQLEPRYNIVPSQRVTCVRTNPKSSNRKCLDLQWGLVLSWAKDPSIGNKLINGRTETVAEKSAFRKVVQYHRKIRIAKCVAPFSYPFLQAKVRASFWNNSPEEGKDGGMS